MSLRDIVIEEAHTWLNTPYHHLGDVKGAGVDCAMLLVRIFVDLGLIVPFDPRPYSPQWHLHRSEELYLGWLQQVADEVDEPTPGDVGLYRFGRAYSHGVVLIEGDRRQGTVLHAMRREGRVTVQSVQDQPLLGRPVRWFSIINRIEQGAA